MFFSLSFLHCNYLHDLCEELTGGCVIMEQTVNYIGKRNDDHHEENPHEENVSLSLSPIRVMLPIGNKLPSLCQI